MRYYQRLMDLLKALGYPEETKLLMIHADDAGLSHSENRATVRSLKEGIVNSYSMMVPCPWFFEMAQFARQHPQYDYGIHLTLTSEWENYRFGPVLPAHEVPSLVDEYGYFHKRVQEVGEKASPEEVKRELEAQIERALAFGLRPTHLDSHMYSAGASPAIFKIYKALGNAYGLPVLLSHQFMEMVGLNQAGMIDDQDWLVNKLHMGRQEMFEQGTLAQYYDRIWDDLVSGFNMIIVHPAFDDDEMKGITVNHPHFGAVWRQVDLDAFTSERSRAQLRNQMIKLVTWKEIQEVQKRYHQRRA